MCDDNYSSLYAIPSAGETNAAFAAALKKRREIQEQLASTEYVRYRRLVTDKLLSEIKSIPDPLYRAGIADIDTIRVEGSVDGDHRRQFIKFGSRLEGELKAAGYNVSQKFYDGCTDDGWFEFSLPSQ